MSQIHEISSTSVSGSPPDVVARGAALVISTPAADRPTPRRRPGGVRRWVMLSAGMMLAVAAVVSAPLPVPLEVPLAGGSAMLILRASPRARRLYVRGARRWPRTFGVSDRMLRRHRASRYTALARSAEDSAALEQEQPG